MAKIPFVYLTSPPFSGSTLFSFLVNTHPMIATVGEMTGIIESKDPATYVCSCGRHIRTCPFWNEIAEQMETRGFPFDPASFDTRVRLGTTPLARKFLNASLPSIALEDLRDLLLTCIPRQRRRLAYLIARNKALASSVLHVTGKKLFFDASKSPAIIRYLAREPDIELRVVHLVRDVRGTSYSRAKNKGETDWTTTVNKWIRMNRAIELQLARLSQHNWIRMRYEDVCAFPTKSMNRFFEFCGVPPASASTTLNFAAHHIIGNRMRLGNLSEIRLDEEWRHELPVSDQDYAAGVARPLLARYGYLEPQTRDSDIEKLDTL